MKDTRELSDLVSIGPAMVEDFKLLGITKVNQLKGKDAQKLFLKLCSLTGTKMDICVLDVFQCAIAQAENPLLPREKRLWYYWSNVRKAKSAK